MGELNDRSSGKNNCRRPEKVLDATQHEPLSTATGFFGGALFGLFQCVDCWWALWLPVGLPAFIVTRSIETRRTIKLLGCRQPEHAAAETVTNLVPSTSNKRPLAAHRHGRIAVAVLCLLSAWHLVLWVINLPLPVI
jgi:hypothetical protein